MKDLAEVVGAADSVWAVLAIFFAGVYLIIWKFGGEMIGLARDSNKKATAITKSIVTNHGSKNLGDAVDKLTELTLDALAEQRQTNDKIDQVRREFIAHLADSESIKAHAQDAMAQLDERVTKIEGSNP